MTNWEEAIKDKLGAYESTPPEGVFADIQRRRQAMSVHRPISYSWLWTTLGALAAAGVAALIIFSPLREKTQLNPEQPKAVTAKAEIQASDRPSAEIFPKKETEILRNSISPVDSIVPIFPPRSVKVQEDIFSSPVIEAVEPTLTTEETEETEETEAVKEDTPVIPESIPTSAVQLKSSYTSGAYLAAGALGSIASMLVYSVSSSGINATTGEDTPLNWGDPQKPVSDWRHYQPLRIGLSARVDIAPRLSVTTGINYSLYYSILPKEITGRRMTRTSHYLGVPLRLDWSVYSKKHFEAYLGAGLEGDVCIAARMEEFRIDRNPAMISILGVAGLQLNLTNRLSLYLEPELSYAFPIRQPAWATYQTEHPFLFTVSGGVRIDLAKQ